MAVPPTGKARESVTAYLERVTPSLIPFSPQFSYQSGAPGFNDEDVREYVSEPISALPPSVAAMLPHVTLLLVPFLERMNGKDSAKETTGNGKEHKDHKAAEVKVAYDQPADGRWVPYVSIRVGGEVVIALSVEAQETADYHYHLYHELAHLASEKLPTERVGEYAALLAAELSAGAHGEVDDESWTMKQAVRRHRASAKPSKALVNYAKASFIDTLTLYLHGICCDIDVEPGPRQLPSRHLRKRLKLLQQMLPAPKGYAVFPEELDGVGERAQVL
jgi:hypothetical protein